MGRFGAVRSLGAGLRKVGPIVVAGVLAGFVGAQIVSTVTTGGVVAGSAESPEAHNYLVAYLAGDAATATRYRSTDPLTQAIEYQNVERAAAVRQITSMTYLGGASQGGIGVYAYAVTGRAMGSTNEVMVPFTLTVMNGKIVAVK